MIARRWMGNARTLARRACAQSARPDSVDNAVVLDQALTHVPASGWTMESVRKATRDLELSEASAAAFAPNGGIDIVHHAMKRNNDELRTKLETLSPEEYRTVAIVRRGVRWRLEMQIPYLSRWGEAMAMGALPQNVGTTMGLLHQTMDDIWYAAGDTATDVR